MKSYICRVMETKNTTLCNVLRLNLDDGEAEAGALAIEQDAKMLLPDETGGRTIAEYYVLCFEVGGLTGNQSDSMFQRLKFRAFRAAELDCREGPESLQKMRGE